ncbi:hypothetical protein BD779DRAFT_1790953 [Infundibulicybe gibba]|nr:hypothetical protein BD779DRAFT_1790953 [Infundibulicybe gibba]
MPRASYFNTPLTFTYQYTSNMLTKYFCFGDLLSAKQTFVTIALLLGLGAAPAIVTLHCYDSGLWGGQASAKGSLPSTVTASPKGRAATMTAPIDGSSKRAATRR